MNKMNRDNYLNEGFNKSEKTLKSNNNVTNEVTIIMNKQEL